MGIFQGSPLAPGSTSTKRFKYMEVVAPRFHVRHVPFTEAYLYIDLARDKGIVWAIHHPEYGKVQQ